MRPKPIRMFSRAAMLLLTLMLTATTGWAAEVLRGGTESAPVAITTTAEIITTKHGTSVGYFVVNENTTITHQVRVGYSDNSNIYISIPTGKTLTVEVTGSDPGLRYWTGGCALHVYGGGTLVVSNGIETYGGTCDMHNITINGAHYDDDGYLDGSIHTVTFNSKGGTAVASQTFGLKYGQTIATVTEPTAPTRTNYDFGGWYKESSCTNAWDFASDGVTADVTLYAKWTPDPAHFSVNDAGTEYTIHTATGWNVFCDCLQDNDTYNRFSGKTVRLGADITVSRMAGSAHHDFCGTFDGQGNTLTVNISSDDITDGSTQYVAPFRYVSNTKADPSDEADSPAAFRNLHVTGTITTDKQFTGGLIGGCWGTVSIDNCAVSTAITSTISGDGTHGGIVGIQQNGALTITGCLFDGRLLGATTYAVGGFIGWRKSGAEIRNSLFAPAEVTVQNDGSATFARNKVDTYNSYYTYYLCDGTNYAPYDPADADHPDKYNNGHATRTVDAAADVTIGAVALTGTATQYTVSGITAYSGGGLQRGETLYYGSGDQLSLTLSNSATGAPQGYQYAYTASAGTLSGTTLTMPDEDVTISVNTAALRSTGQPVTVAYINADGTAGEASAIAIDGTETSLGTYDQEKWYFAGLPEVNFDHTVTLNGNVHIILSDGKTMNVGTSSERIDAYGIIRGTAPTLSIYGQTLGTGALNVYTTGINHNAICSNAITINGGHVTANADGQYASGLWAYLSDVAINGGKVEASGTRYGIVANGTITLGWSKPTERITASSYYGTVAVADGKSLYNGNEVLSGTITDMSKLDGKTLMGVDVLQDAATNDVAALATRLDGKQTNVALSGRTLTKDGNWNTLCLPFSLTEEQIAASPLAGATIKEMATTSNLDANGVLTLNFSTVTAIEAGTPYIIKWTTTGDNIVNPVFQGVTISSTTPTAVESRDWNVTFVGQYSPFSIVNSGATGDNQGNKNEILLMTKGNKIGYSQNPRTLNCFRCHFYVPTNNDEWLARNIEVDFGEGETTSLSEELRVKSEECNATLRSLVEESTGSWYSLDGRKLEGKPTAKGMYIVNGRKVIIK